MGNPILNHITINGKKYGIKCNQLAKISFEKVMGYSLRKFFSNFAKKVRDAGLDPEKDEEKASIIWIEEVGDMAITSFLYACLIGGGEKVSFEDAANMVDEAEGSSYIEKIANVFKACLECWSDGQPKGEQKNVEKL
jgi:hypothetical protein